MSKSIRERIEINFIKSLSPEEINKILTDFNNKVKELEKQTKEILACLGESDLMLEEAGLIHSHGRDILEKYKWVK